MPTGEIVFLGLIGMGIVGLLSIQRRERRRRDGAAVAPGVLWPANVRLATIVLVLFAFWIAGNAAMTAIGAIRPR
jgi:hypothetical protein